MKFFRITNKTLKFTYALLQTLPPLVKAKRLDKQGKVTERDELMYAVAKRWSTSLVKLLDSDLHITGHDHIPQDRPVVFISNHQSNYDIPIVMYSINRLFGFISKKEIEKWPIIGTWMEYLHCIFMDRSDVRQSLKAINEGAKNIDKGYSMLIFPEGTRSNSRKMNEFKAGSFKLALKSGAPIVPIAIDGSYLITGNASKGMKSKVKVSILEPVYLENLSKEELKEVHEQVYQAIQEKLS